MEGRSPPSSDTALCPSWASIKVKKENVIPDPLGATAGKSKRKPGTSTASGTGDQQLDFETDVDMTPSASPSRQSSLLPLRSTNQSRSRMAPSDNRLGNTAITPVQAETFCPSPEPLRNSDRICASDSSADDKRSIYAVSRIPTAATTSLDPSFSTHALVSEFHQLGSISGNGLGIRGGVAYDDIGQSMSVLPAAQVRSNSLIERLILFAYRVFHRLLWRRPIMTCSVKIQAFTSIHPIPAPVTRSTLLFSHR